jgi:twinkle protein
LIPYNVGLQQDSCPRSLNISEYKTACPHCDSSDAYTVYEDGHGYCFSCEAYDKVANPTDNPTPKSSSPFKKETLQAVVIKPLEARKILKKTCNMYGYGYAGGKQVATYHWDGTKVAQHHRDRHKNFMWSGDVKHLELWGQHLFKGGGQRLIITEGEVDCMTIAQVLNLKTAVVSLPSGAQSAVKYIKMNLPFVESFKEVILAFDADEPGQEAVKKVAPLISIGKVKTMHYNGYKDANELLLECRGAELPELIFGAKPWRPDGIILGSDIKFDLILEEPPVGLPTPYPLFNDMSLGTRQGEIILYTAGSGVGKSTLAKEKIFHLLTQHNQKVGIMAWEESLKRSVEGLMSLDLNVPLHNPDRRILVPQEKLHESYKRVINHPNVSFDHHWGSSDIDSVLNKIRYMVRGLGMQWILLDHISIVVSGLDDSIGGGERKQLDILMTKLRSLVEETGVGVLAIVHLKRPGIGKAFTEGRTVSLSDLRGSAALEQLSDMVVALERDQQGTMSDISTIRILKSRLIGKLGVADTLEYNHESGRLLPYVEGTWSGKQIEVPTNDF